ncbi:Asialoglycoprotein receptor 1 [Channa argus]|uniref:Asialoglycoprotein receptor 1 n=1 Tax=Channa argus TaxID=215402 RepID=A0A6G1Q7G6_CHAAH|nr:Asialoglycoprotein receptor 1 [Channa argus]
MDDYQYEREEDRSALWIKETAKEVQKLKFTVENNKDQLTSGSATGGCCPFNWDLFGSSCYYFSSLSLSWNRSKDWCEKEGSHLVILTTNEEWDFVTHHTMPNPFWVGLTDGRTGRWEWVNQTPYIMERRRWMPGQPDSWTGHGLQGNEDCAQLHSSGRLNDMHCSKQLRYICQKHSLRG